MILIAVQLIDNTNFAGAHRGEVEGAVEVVQPPLCIIEYEDIARGPKPKASQQGTFAA